GRPVTGLARDLKLALPGLGVVLVDARAGDLSHARGGAVLRRLARAAWLDRPLAREDVAARRRVERARVHVAERRGARGRADLVETRVARRRIVVVVGCCKRG